MGGLTEIVIYANQDFLIKNALSQSLDKQKGCYAIQSSPLDAFGTEYFTVYPSPSIYFW